ncbi:flavodoxin family protein [Pseudaminobacter arsenicus]|uniref:Flavodoxin family protein n=1 Tax=Borborobacter arsenicus TaxID=1851146 RepID=A0A432V855_9HYPH|nr:NAD(P)H-dependent oxidoreductase [Pseudaminobacter arsenicus]RUM98327.1 flavodoxin family protein [Pseudaminobacter arsenicus]
MTRVLGISSSLRNARFGLGSKALVEELARTSTQDELASFLQAQTKLRFDDFVAAGRADGKPFDEIYAALRKLRGERGLSNSEAALAAALWAAQQEGAEISHVSLSAHFPVTGKGRNLDRLAEEIQNADALVLSGPVYFGDRGSLAQSLVEFIASDPKLKAACKGKVYGGLAVGAKRNGGQETTLIYQMLDMVNLDFLAVGNSSETTAQYGGTAVAGDVGKFHSDAYGIETCLGTGRRVARVANYFKSARETSLHFKDRLKIQLWLLQDTADGAGYELFHKWAKDVEAAVEDVDISVVDVAREEVVRCIACDVCPVDVGKKEDYRCIITTSDDFFVKHHKDIIEPDAVLICSYSPEDRSNLVSVYQQFIERTRYLRRDNYALTDILVAPFVISELSARQNLHLRMLTSAIRHHTVLHHPIIGMIYDGEFLARKKSVEMGCAFVDQARKLALGRHVLEHADDLVYKPVGYEISAHKAEADAVAGKTQEAVRAAADRHAQNAKRRLAAG